MQTPNMTGRSCDRPVILYIRTPDLSMLIFTGVTNRGAGTTRAPIVILERCYFAMVMNTARGLLSLLKSVSVLPSTWNVVTVSSIAR